MKNSIFYILVLILLTSLFSTNALAATQESASFAADLNTGIPATVDYGYTFESMNGFFDISVSGVSEGSDIINGIYPGWCIQHYIVGKLHNQPATLYASTSTNLPSDVAGLPWNKINYVLNHKIQGSGKTDLAFIQDVQTAIWILLGEENPGASPQAQQMVADADAHPEYVPGEGEITAVIIYSDGMSRADANSAQESIIEVRLNQLPASTPTSTGTLVDAFTSTATPTSTETLVDTFTPTATPTSTGTLVDTFTPTATPTSTGTLVDTFTPTATPTSTGTLVDTFTPTATPTSTGTLVDTFTPTGTLTDTPTSTSTLTPIAGACQPTVVTAVFSKIASGSSIEGMGVVAPNLNIDAKGTAIKIAEGESPIIFGAPNISNYTINGGLNPNGGFSDLITKTAQQAHQYTFTFAAGTTINKLSVHMLDFGDLNPANDPYHYASITAFDANNNVVSKSELSFVSDANYNSPQYGYLGTTGDAKLALPGQPGNWMWNVAGSGITKVVLDFGSGYDPNIAFDTLSFTTECQQLCALPIVSPNFSSIASGSSIEGMGVVAPNLNIDAKGTAIKIAEGESPIIFGAPNISNYTINGGLNPNGGFSDLITKTAQQAHQYTFTFAAGTTINKLSVHMLDFGDLNPANDLVHYASISAFDANNNVVSKSELSFIGDANYNSPQYGYLGTTGDAKLALPGQPGNWMWNVAGPGITKVVLDFGSGYDPNVAFDTLSFCPSP